MSRLQCVRGSLRVPQPLIGGFTGVGMSLAQAGNTDPGLPYPACRQRHHPLAAAYVAGRHPSRCVCAYWCASPKCVEILMPASYQ